MAITPGSGQLPTRDELFRALDTEILVSGQANARSGWTPWALLLALGALAWSLSEDLRQHKPSLSLVAQSFVFMSVLLDYAIFLSAVLRNRLPDRIRKPMYKTTLAATTRLTKLLFILWYGSIIVLNWLYADSVPHVVRSAITLVYCLTVIKQFESLILPRRVHIMPLPMRFPIGLCIWYTLVTVLVTAGYWHIVQTDVVAVRMGLIAGMIIQLLFWLVRTYSDAPLLGTLRRIRRDVVFGNLTLEAAAREFECAMTGRQLTAVLQAECAAVLESINTLRQLAGAITPLIISLRNSLDNADAAASRATFNRLFRHQAQFANSYNVIERAIRQFGVIHADATIIGHIVRDPVQDDDLREQLTSNLQAVMRDYVQAYSIIKHHPLRAVDGNTQP